MTFPARPRHGSPSSVPVVASHVHVRRWQADEWDDAAENPGLLTGTLYELTPAPDPESDGLLGPDGRPIERPEPPRKRRMGFLPPKDCE